MFCKLLGISIVLISIHEACSSYLIEEKNFHKTRMERNNKVNTAVWKRGGEAEMERRVYHGDFMLPGSSPDVGSRSDAAGGFAENNVNMNNEGDYSAANYFSRFKRAVKSDKRDATPCTGDDTNCIETTEGILRTKKVKPEFVSKLKPATVFNEYPYQIAVLLNDDLNEIVKKAENGDRNLNKNEVELKVIPLTDGKDYVDIYVTPTDRIVDINEIYAKLREAANHTLNPIDPPVKPTDYETEAIKNMILTEKVDGSDDNEITNQNKIMGVFNKENQAWPYKVTNIDAKNNKNVVPKAKSNIVSKTINGEGLIKVLSMLTKTFKKVMKQHEDIKKIHGQFHGASDDFMKNIDEMTKKFQAFEQKHNLIVELSKKIALTETKMDAKYILIEKDQRELTKTLADFEQQQRKFVLQQKQFNAIQKAILAQNEEINQKQTLITRSQSTVSHRQNEFARIIQKVRKLYNSRKNPKLSPNIKNPKNTNESTTTAKPALRPNVVDTTESIKINLFSIPVKEKLKNQDENILSEKDDQSIDDIVYKFYFNNTFIDNLLKTGVLASFVNEPNSAQRGVKKRSREDIQKLIEKTVLMPVASDHSEAPVKRERRWINRKNNPHLKPPVANRFKSYDDSENPHKKKKSHNVEDAQTKLKKINRKNVDKLNIETNPNAHDGSDPFRLMATNFCNQIKQNTNSQILDWCIEKALRKLQAIDVKASFQPFERKASDNVEALAKTIHTFRQFKPSEASFIKTQTESTTSVQLSTDAGHSRVGETTSPLSTQGSQDSLAGMFFPDNDQLESNLKQYELVPDKEGTVFYDGSVHSSKIVAGPDDEAASDILPGMDSDSRVDIDPRALELQAKRRAYVRSFNAKILKEARNQ